MLRSWAALALVTTVSACDPPRALERSEVPFSACRPPGVTAPALCGTVTVPEARDGTGARTIDLEVLVVPALKPTEDDPVFFLAGGPGQASTEVARMVMPALDRVHRTRDVVFVDQRGTGGSNPLDCELYDDADPADRFASEFPKDRVAKCRDELTERADPRQYLTTAAVADLEEVRRALGYARVNLVGGSYGTRVALVYARRHPEKVRSMVLDGVAPPNLRLFLDFLEDGQRALDLLLSQCESDDACRAAHPDLGSELAALLEDLEAHPKQVEVRHPRTGEPVKLEVTRDTFTGVLRGLLYSAELTELVPLLVRQMRGGDFSGLVAEGLLLTESTERTMSVGLFLSVACAEDVARIEDAEATALAAKSFLGRRPIDEIREVCASWPKGEVEAGYFEPVESDIPTLVLSGELDPVTPPRWGEDVARHLTRARHVVVRGVGHGVMAKPCADHVIAAFIDRADASAVDVSCFEKSRRPPFFIDLLGPTP